MGVMEFGKERITESYKRIEAKQEKSKFDTVTDLIAEGKGNLFIVSHTGLSYEEVRSIRRRYEKAHSSCN